MESKHVVLLQAKTKRMELLSLIRKLIEYYGGRSDALSRKATRLRLFSLGACILGIGMLGFFIVKGDGSGWWNAFGVSSVAVVGVGAIVVTFFERRSTRAGECLDRVGELIEWADYIQREVLTLDNARERRQWYTSRIGILKCEYVDAQQTMGGIEFEELAMPPKERADKLLDTIAEVGTTVAIIDLSDDVVDSVASGLHHVLAGLAD